MTLKDVFVDHPPKLLSLLLIYPFDKKSFLCSNRRATVMRKKITSKRKVLRKKPTYSPVLFYSLTLCVLIGIVSLLWGGTIANSQQVLGDSVAPNEIIVKYKSTTSETERDNQRRKSKASLKKRIDKLHVEVVTFNEGTIPEKIKEFKNNPFVEYAEPNYKAAAFAITNDTALSQQWGLYKINAANQTTLSAWDSTIGSSVVKVAILDTGIEESHSDLLGKVVGNANFTNTTTVFDQNGHGTHVAGITAAATNNGNGVAGTGYNTVLLNGKVLDDSGSGYYSWIANGVVWAADQGANVINLSLGGSSSSQTLQDAINYAWSKGVVIVAAAGNNNTSTPNYPAYYANAIAVAATDANDARASFSNYGNWVDVAAPGTSIYSTYKGNVYATMSGTSMATPFAAGTAALIWAKGTCTTNVCVREKLEKTADPISGTGTAWTWGRINAYKAVSEELPTITQTATPTPLQSASIMTVSNIGMSYTTVSSTYRRIYATVKVINQATKAPLSNATVTTIMSTPSGKKYTLSGKTNTQGQTTVTLRSNELGTYTTTVTNVTRTSYTYTPTVTSATLQVN